MRLVDDFIIFPVPEDSALDNNEIEQIVTHTHNTWQQNRPIEEIRANTKQGKKAEIVVEKFLEDNSRSRYLSYDKIRRDEFEKHAPFDGIIYSITVEREVLIAAIEHINEDVRTSAGDSGTITVSTREFMENNGIYTVEIKSSMLQDPRDYVRMQHKIKEERTEDDYRRLCEYIKGFYDYFVYPHFCRDNINIKTFYDYTVFIRRQRNYFPKDKQAFLYDLMKDEYDNACDIYTRVFFDNISNEIIIPGYVIKTRFFEEPRIRKMPSPKSRNAIYYMYHMRLGKSLIEIDNDEEISRWNRTMAYAKLLCAYNPHCPNCGNDLRLVESFGKTEDRKNKFLYVCDTCEHDKWFEMNRIFPRNMEAK